MWAYTASFYVVRKEQPMLIINAKIITMDSADIEKGYIKISGGKIEAVGEMSEKPSAVQNEDIIDLAGKIAMPGFIDAHSHIGLQEDGLGDEGDDINEMTDSFTPHLRALDGINPFDKCFAEAKAAGITCVAVSPGSANSVGGQICVMKTEGRWIDEMLVSEFAAVKFALGENPKTVYSDKSQSPSTRMASAAAIRENLYKAQRYMQDKEKAVQEETDLPEYDARMEALVPLLKGEVKAHIHAHRAYDIMTGIRIAKEFGLDFVLVHCTEGYLVADILGEMQATAICGPVISARMKPELSGATLKNSAELEAAGIKVSICTDHPVIPQDFLPLSMQIAHANGLSSSGALAAITINAAIAAGVDDRVGSISPGKDADIQVYSKDPLTTFAKPEMVFINGKCVV